MIKAAGIPGSRFSRQRLRPILLGLLVASRVTGVPAEGSAAGHDLGALGVLSAEQGREAADFALPDAGGTVQRLRDYRGKVVLLSFGATW